MVGIKKCLEFWGSWTNQSFNLSRDIEIFDFDSGSWKSAGFKLEQGIQDFCTVAISEDEFIIIGGVNSEIER